MRRWPPMPGPLSIQRLKRHLNTSNLFIAVCLLLLFLFCVYPFAVLGMKSFLSGANGSFNTAAWQKLTQSSSSLTALINTLSISAAVGILGLLIATPVAWLLARTDIPCSNKLKTLFSLPFAIPPYIGAIAWIILANPSTGILNTFLPESLKINIYSSFGLIWVMSSFLYTFALLLILSSLNRMDASLEEAARISGASPLQVFFKITLPLIFPSIMGGFFLIFLAAAASFGVPAMIGNPARIYLLTTKIYTLQKMGSMSGIYQAGMLAFLLLAIAAIGLIVNQKLMNKRDYQIVSGKSSRPSLIDLGTWRWPIFSCLITLLVIIFFLPISGIMLSAFSKLQGKIQLDNFTFDNINRLIFETHETPRAFFNSLRLGALAATVATALGVLFSFIRWKTKIYGRKWIEIFASLPYSAPGTVVALAVILAFSGNFLGIFPSLYNTLSIIALAYVIKFLCFAIRTTGDAFCQIDDCLAEASRVSGATWLQTLQKIWLPLLKPALFAAWILIFMPSFSELTMTILLSGPGIETIGTLLFQMQEYSDASGGGSAVLCLLVIIFVFISNSLIKTISKGKYGL